MARQKRKLSAKQKAEKARLRQEYMWIFVGGKQKRVRRPPTIDGMDAEEWLRQNADPIFLHQNELWHLMPENVAAGEEFQAWDEEDAAGLNPAGAGGSGTSCP
jgi:hypothetical protein